MHGIDALKRIATFPEVSVAHIKQLQQHTEQMLTIPSWARLPHPTEATLQTTELICAALLDIIPTDTASDQCVNLYHLLFKCLSKSIDPIQHGLIRDTLQAPPFSMTEQRMLYHALKRPHALRHLLLLYPENKRMSVPKESFPFCYTLLHVAITKHLTQSIDIILSLLPPSKRLETIQLYTLRLDTSLHLAADKPDVLHLLLTHCPREHVPKVIAMEDKNGQTVLHRAAKHDEAIQTILTFLPNEAERSRALNRKDDQGRSARQLIEDRLMSKNTPLDEWNLSAQCK